MNASEITSRGRYNAQLKFVEKIFTERYNYLRKTRQYHMLPPELQDDDLLATLEALDNQQDLSLIKTKTITINPPPDANETDWSQLKLAVEDIVFMPNMLIDPHWTYEQRGTIDRPTGFHAHIAFSSKIKKSDILKRVYLRLRHYYPEIEPHSIHINTNSPRAYAYVHQEKVYTKAHKLTTDQQLRRKYFLKDYYHIDPDTQTIVGELVEPTREAEKPGESDV